jgi:hypothetical protein
MLLLLIKFIGLFGFGLMLMEACKLRLSFFMEIPIAFVLGLWTHFVLTNLIVYFFRVHVFEYSAFFLSLWGIGFLVWKFFGRKVELEVREVQTKMINSKIGFEVFFVVTILFVLESLVLFWHQVFDDASKAGLFYQELSFFFEAVKNSLQSSTIPFQEVEISGSVFEHDNLANHFGLYFLNKISKETVLPDLFAMKTSANLLAAWGIILIILVLCGKSMNRVQLLGLTLAILNLDFLILGSELTLQRLLLSTSISLQLALILLLVIYTKTVFSDIGSFRFGPVLVCLLLCAATISVRITSWGTLVKLR